MDAPITITLTHPIEIKNGEGEIIETIRQLTLPRAQAKHLRAMDKATGDVGKSLALIAALAGVPPSHLDGLDGEDFMVLSGALADFLGVPQPTGAMSSPT